MTFEECLMHCAASQELLAEFNRLTGHSLGKIRSPIGRLIDEATGYEQAGVAAFVEFVAEYIWMPLMESQP